MKLFIILIFFPLFLFGQPSATISSSGNVCVNSTSPTITITGANGTAPYTFTYHINSGADQIVSSGSFNNVSISVPTSIAGGFNYILTNVSSSNGSQSTYQAVLVTIYPNPTAIVNSPTICPENSGTIVATPGLAASYSYNWVVLPIGVSNPGNVANFTSNIDGDYGVIITNTTTGCVSQISYGTLSYVNSPNASISGTTSICQNSASPSIIFTGNSASAPYSFIYNINGGSNQSITSDLSGIANISAPTNSIGTFAYNLVSVSSYCTSQISDQAIITVDDCAVIKENELMGVLLFPNPTESILNIESESIINAISIYSLNGHLVKYLTPLTQKSIIDLSDLTQGVYLVELNSEKGRIVKRIIVE